MQQNNINVLSFIYTDNNAVPLPNFGRQNPGMGPIHMDEVGCTGNENSLLNGCPHLRTHNCDHTQDAGVRCLGMHNV